MNESRRWGGLERVKELFPSLPSTSSSRHRATRLLRRGRDFLFNKYFFPLWTEALSSVPVSFSATSLCLFRVFPSTPLSLILISEHPEIWMMEGQLIP